MQFKRIHIIGGPGSGKSYMANLISNQTNIKNYNLDDIFWNNSTNTFGIKADTKVRDMNLQKILLNNQWVIEGVYYGWLSASFDKADIIIVLKTNVYTRDWRIIKRFLMRNIGLETCNKRETLKGMVGLIKWNHNYDKKNMIEAEQMIDKFPYKKVVINNSKEMYGLLKTICINT
ncbi:MAG: topology modulation protein [Clostridiaceae bacterium]|nr:topology modulation protein [Clostridiaceae bacterium]